jgi:alpha-methylacyl-CoA racemase
MGPLAGVKIIEIKGIGPGPFAGMLLADMGAEVIVVERSSKGGGLVALPAAMDCNSRGKKSIALNLKTPAGVEALLQLVESADMLFEGFRPGVAERLGFGPDPFCGLWQMMGVRGTQPGYAFRAASISIPLRIISWPSG